MESEDGCGCTQMGVVRKRRFPAAPNDVVRGQVVVLHHVIVVGVVVVAHIVVVVVVAVRMASPDLLPRFSPPHLSIELN